MTKNDTTQLVLCFVIVDIEHIAKQTVLTLQKILLTSVAQDLYGDGVDCQDEYVEILDGDTVDALSLGK